MRTAKVVANEMGVSQSTAYDRLALLLGRGLLRKEGRAYAPSREGLRIARPDHDTLGNLMFWLCDDLGCDSAEARNLALAFLFRLPVRQIRALADRRALCAAISRAGAPAGGALAALPYGGHRVRVFVHPGGGVETPAVELRRSAVCVSDGKSRCVLELSADHVRRIVLACERRRGAAALLQFLSGGVWTPACETAGRFHIRGDALAQGGERSENGGLVARVRVRAAIDARHTPAEAELVLRF
jgi:hypothetical protein